MSFEQICDDRALPEQLRGLDPSDPVAQVIIRRHIQNQAIKDAMAWKQLRDRSIQDASSDEETGDSIVIGKPFTRTVLIDGKKCTLVETEDSLDGVTNGVAKGDDEEATPPEPIDPKDVGMTPGFKDLFAGKADKHGQFTWSDKKPSDLGKPVEDAETAKWALIVRNKRVYGDPRKVLAIHSIVVQSPLLRKLLKRVLKDYPGVTTSLKRLEFSGKFEPLIHRWSEFQHAVAGLSDSETDKTTKAHAALLQEVLEKEFKSAIDESQDLIRNGVTTYEYLWTIFQPGGLVYTRQDGQDMALKLINTQYGTDRQKNPCFWISGKYVDWSGSMWGTTKLNLRVYPFSGTRKIQNLSSYPFKYHSDKDALRQRLIERGAKVESYAGSHYKAYHGIAYNYDNWGNKDKHNIKDRIMIDTYGWNKFQPNSAVIVQPLAKDSPALTNGTNGDHQTDLYDDESDDCDDYDPADECNGGGMPLDGMIEEDNKAGDLPPLTEEQKLICTPLLRGYALKSKEWLNFFVNAVQDITFNERAFDSLVLPSNQKELILGFTESQRQNKGFDDVIEGKGKGIIILLCGPPGVGKTLTAESTSERMQAPLYMMSSGDLGLDARHIENKLSMILEMCTRWKAILLLDEADVFLEERSLHELERNKLVSIFLRILEYYEGIMFLTTNRVKTFDQAFQSRIHISLEYPELSIDSRKTVWKNFLVWNKNQGHDNCITEKQLDKLALMTLNGRQIKNILKTAQLLANRREQMLGHEHIVNVLDVTQHLHNATQHDERTRSSIFM